jgi:hypothetical protein
MVTRHGTADVIPIWLRGAFVNNAIQKLFDLRITSAGFGKIYRPAIS